jgi:ABC-2 type transport system ATP-binding protein
MALDEPATLQSTLPGIMLEVSTEGARPPIEAMGRLPGVDDVQLFGDRAHVRLASGQRDAAGRVATGLKDAGIPGATVRAVPPSLEDVFIHLVTRAGNASDGQPGHGA